MVDLSLDRLTGAYVKLREARAELKRKFDEEDKELREKQDLISARLLEWCSENGLESGRTEHGTFYRTIKTRYWATDWSAVYKYVLENEMPEMFEKRLSQGVIRQLMEEEGVEVPGVNADTEYVITVRKK